MKFNIIVFYKNQKALERFLNWFIYRKDLKCVSVGKDEQLYMNEAITVRCCRRLNESYRGLRADLIAVEEEITWTDNWKYLQDCILYPKLTSNFKIQVFDSINYLEAEQHEKTQEERRGNAECVYKKDLTGG